MPNKESIKLALCSVLTLESIGMALYCIWNQSYSPILAFNSLALGAVSLSALLAMFQTPPKA